MPTESLASTRAATFVRKVSRLVLQTISRLSAATVAVAACVLATSACGSAPRDASTIVMASGTDLESGNPLITIHSLTRQIQRHALFVTLVKFDSTLQPTPYFARTWTWSSDRRVLSMSLLRGLAWHDGVPTTAADVQFTFAAVKDPAVGSPRAGDFASLDSTHIVNDTAIQLYFRISQVELPNVLAELPLVPKHLLDSVPRATWRSATFSRTPVGNGPFAFVDRIPGRRWRFARNVAFPLAMGGPPSAQQIVVAVVDEAATKFAGLVSGELDIAGVSPSMARLVVADPTLQLLTPPALFSNVLAFNVTKAPLNDVRIRRAIALSIDRQRIVQAAVAGFATPSSSAIPPGLPMSRDAAPIVDTLQADRMLDSAGWVRRAKGMRARAGVSLRLELLTVGSGDMAIEQLVQSDLAARGIDIRIRVADQATFLSSVRARAKQFDIAITGIPGDISLGQLSALFSSLQQGGALDYTAFHNVTLDSALDVARAAALGQSNAAWWHVDSLVQMSAPMIWLYHARGVQGLSRRLTHVTMDLRGELVSVARWTRADQSRTDVPRVNAARRTP